jgi:RHS repeat-associated protein
MGDFGLMYYNARWYDPYLNRWTQPDTIVPDSNNPQAWDRYGYALNNPIRYNDPSGHNYCDRVRAGEDEDCQYVRNLNRDRELHRKLRDFKPPTTVGDDEMITVGIWPFLDQVSPNEYRLLLDRNGNLDYGLLFRMYQAQQNALGAAQQSVPGSMLNSPGDAFRHAYWNALMTREFGAEFAAAYGNAHETSAVPPGYPGNEAAEQFMDLHNNEVGIGIGATNPGATDQVLQQKAMQALRDGQLYVWDGSDIYYSNECPVCNFH